MNKKHIFYVLPIILLLIVVVAGWFATDYLVDKSRKEIIGNGHASLLTLSIYVSATFTSIEGAVKSLTGSPWIATALMSKMDRDIEHANSALDRYNSSVNASVTYLMDADGMTVASSNRNDPDSFVGKSYRFRPYFQEAAKGKPSRYFAMGITSGKRGFYASSPVQNHLGEVMGVVAMKKDIDDIESFFSKYPFCFLVSPDGVIFLSGTPAMITKSLWPLDNAVRDTLIESRQFGNKLSEAVFKQVIADGTEVTFEGKVYFVFRKEIDSNGWSIVLLAPTDHTLHDRLIGILATISVSFLIMILSGIIYVIDRSKETIRQSEESKRLLLHAAGNGIFGVDARGHVTFINPAAMRMLGFAEEEMLGQSVHSLIHHSHADGSSYPEEVCPMYASYTQAADSHVTNEVLWRKDGSSFPVEYSSMPITQDGKVTGAVVSFMDITERKQAEVEKARLEAQNHQMHKAESLGRMAGAIAHHFNNQLYAVMGNLEMAMDDLPLGVNSNESLTEAMQAARKAADVSRLMLTYLGQTPGKHEPIDLSETCRQSLTLLHAATPRGIIINAKSPPSGPVIRADTNQIHQIFTNLTTNAWEAISDNRGTIALTVKTVSHEVIPTSKRFPIDWQPQEIAFACLEVSDTGSGIANKDIETIFDPFFTTKFTGRGLGLPVVMGIVKAHGGGITVESEPGHGSTFRVFLPLSTEELPIQHDLPTIPGALHTGKAEEISRTEGVGTVLLIEDEVPVRNMAKKMLTRLGYTVLEAKDGVEAVDVFQKHHDEIFFVLSDLTMPRMNGWETLAALRKLSPDIPVILSSGYDEAQVMADAHPERPNAFLGKPYQLKGLRDMIQKVIGETTAADGTGIVLYPETP